MGSASLTRLPGSANIDGDRSITASPVKAQSNGATLPGGRAPPEMFAKIKCRVSHDREPGICAAQLAVAAGFEPAEGVNPHTLSRRAP
jgi:hypothetical protein